MDVGAFGGQEFEGDFVPPVAARIAFGADAGVDWYRRTGAGVKRRRRLRVDVGVVVSGQARTALLKSNISIKIVINKAPIDHFNQSY